MTVNEAIKLLKQIAKKRGNRKLRILTVEDGIPFANDIELIEPMESYDGKDVWIIPQEETESPKWAK